MNLRAMCVNESCPSFGIQKSVMVGQFSGYGAANDRVICPACGQLMRTIRSINVSKAKGIRKLIARTYLGRTPFRKKSKRTSKKVYKRWSRKRS